MESAAACTFSYLMAPRSDAHGFPRALHDVFGRCTARLRPKIHSTIAIKVNTSPPKTRRMVSALRGLSRVHTSPLGRGNGTGKPAGAGLISATVIANPHHRTRAAERAQALDVHCVLDPSNPSNPSDGAPLDQLCPSMRGCLSIRAAVNAHSAATHNKTSNAGTRSAARHQVAGQAQPPAAR